MLKLVVDLEIKKIIQDAIWAPSGDNSQPWRFEITGDKLKIFNIPTRDNPILNFQQSGSYIAHGALIENICLCASALGYEAVVTLFPRSTESDIIAEVSLNKSGRVADPLERFIKERHTNRKPYRTETLNNQVLNNLRQTEKQEYGRVAIISHRNKINEVAPALSVMEKIALEHKNLHRLFFGDILWSEAENRKGKPGLFIKTLEVPPPARLLFRILKFWSATRFANFFGFSHLASRGNAKLYTQSGAYAVILSSHDSPTGFVNAGRLTQRVWLTATSLGLSVQPVTGILFMGRRFLARDVDNFNSQHVNQAISAYETIKTQVGVNNKECLAMLLRIGYSEPPTARSARMSPQIQFGEEA